MTDSEAVLGGLLIGLLALIVFLLLLGLIYYILWAIGISKIAKNEGLGDKAWLAWIPLVGTFLLPMLVEKDVHKEIRGKFTLIFGVSIIAGALLGQIIAVFAFLSLAVLIYGFYFLAKRYSKNEVAHVIIASISLGISLPIQLIMFSRRERIDPIEEEVIIIE